MRLLWSPEEIKLSRPLPSIRYRNVVRNDALDKNLFKPDWPKGTEKVKN